MAVCSAKQVSKKGIDLAGGSVITFQADSDAPTDDQMQVVESIFPNSYD